MAKKYLDYDGLLYFWQKIKTVFVPTTRKVNGKALSADITLSASDVSALPSSTVIPSPGTGSSYPAMDGTRALGTNAGYARVDHVHPTDSTRAPLASPTFTGTPTAPTPSSGTSTTQIATAEYVLEEIDNALGSFNVGVTDVKIDSSSIVTQGIANIPTASTSAKGLMTTAQVTKLNGIETGAEVNQNAFGEITVDVGGTPITIAATEESDEITFTPGSNVTLTPDDTNKTITIAATDTKYSVVTAGTSTTSGGLMSQADKTKLNGIATGAEVNQNAFSNVKVGSTTVAADAKTDTLELEAGTNITLTPDATNDKVTIAFSGTIPTVPSTLVSYGQGYAECSTASATVAKTASLGNFSLKNYGIVAVKFTNGCSNIRTLNIQSTGAKYIRYKNTTTTSSTDIALDLGTNRCALFMYNGTQYELLTYERSNASINNDGYMNTAQVTKLAGIETGAEVNQNAFSNIKVGSTTIEADTKTDTLELVAGSNISLTPDETNDKVTIGFSGTIPTIPNNFGTVKVGSTNVVADSTSDTLELVAGSNITLTPDATNDKVTINALDNVFEAIYNTTSYSSVASAASSGNIVFTKPYSTDTPLYLVSISSTQAIFSRVSYSNGLAQFAYVTLSSSNTWSSVSSFNLAKDTVASTSANGLMSSTDKTKLDSLIMTNGVIDASNLPSYVDDVVEAYARSGQTALSQNWLATGSASGTVITPEAGKIYVLMADSGDYAANTQFRWGGSAYVKMADGGVSSITNAEIDTIVAS